MTNLRDVLSAIFADARDPPPPLPQRLCVAAAADLGVTGVGMALMSQRGHEDVVAATDGEARTLEDLQFTLGEGPCIDASTGGRPILEPDLARTASRRWPGFGPAVLETRVAALFAFPLQIRGIRLGVLDLYRDVPGRLLEAEVTAALVYSDAAVIVLLHLQSEMGAHDGLHPELADAAGNRPDVHQATGMVSVQAGVSPAEALLLPRAHAFAHKRPILDVARDVVERKIRIDLDTRDNDGQRW
jgi:hypothetical protein